MSKIACHFRRTIALANIFKVDFEELSILLERTINDLTKLNSQPIEIGEFAKFKYAERFKEIYSIEREKLSLRDSKEDVSKIFIKEAKLNVQREMLLALSFNELEKISLVVNPLVYLYKSDWGWVVRNPFFGSFNIEHVLATKKDSHYFLLEKTGTHDIWDDSNISEFPLNEYQYFLLQFFINPINISEAVDSFSKTFEITNIKEKEELLTISEDMIKEFIFRRFIVIHNAERSKEF